ncbi:hypothetical protein [Halomonas sp.]|uniref:hypothetical protein n=1 Tax=Halomonas sp. TaxID=1486246 RepID=UPI00356A7096
MTTASAAPIAVVDGMQSEIRRVEGRFGGWGKVIFPEKREPGDPIPEDRLWLNTYITWTKLIEQVDADITVGDVQREALRSMLRRFESRL